MFVIPNYINKGYVRFIKNIIINLASAFGVGIS
jgi:hypothetical protein